MREKEGGGMGVAQCALFYYSKLGFGGKIMKNCALWKFK